jgi:hypothetical protein
MPTAWDYEWESELAASFTCYLWWRTHSPEKGVVPAGADAVSATVAWTSYACPVTATYDLDDTLTAVIACPVGIVPRRGVYLQVDLDDADSPSVAVTRARAAITAQAVAASSANRPAPLAVIEALSADWRTPAGLAVLLPELRKARTRALLADGPRIEMRKYVMADVGSSVLGQWLAALKPFGSLVLSDPPLAPRRGTLRPVTPLSTSEICDWELPDRLRLVSGVKLRANATIGRRCVALPVGYLRAAADHGVNRPSWGIPDEAAIPADPQAGAAYTLVAIADERAAAPLPGGSWILRSVYTSRGKPLSRPLALIPPSTAYHDGFKPVELSVPPGYACVTAPEWNRWCHRDSSAVTVEFKESELTREIMGGTLLSTAQHLWHLLAACGETAWWPDISEAFSVSADAVWGVLHFMRTRVLDSGLLGMAGAASDVAVYGRFARYTAGADGVLEHRCRGDNRVVLLVPTASIAYACAWAVTHLSDAAYARARILRSVSCPEFAFLLFPAKWAQLAAAQRSWYEWYVCDNSDDADIYRRDRAAAATALGNHLQKDIRCARWLRSRLPSALDLQPPPRAAHTTRIPRVRVQPHQKPTEG